MLDEFAARLRCILGIAGYRLGLSGRFDVHCRQDHPVRHRYDRFFRFNRKHHII